MRTRPPSARLASLREPGTTNVPSTRLGAAVLVGATLALAAVMAPTTGCRERVPPRVASTPPRVPPSVLSARAIAGDWAWSLVDQKDGVRRVEVERWHLVADRGAIRGEYERLVTLLSVDGDPFQCSQTASYQLHSTYHVDGSYLGRQLELVERSHDAPPSPCDSGERRLTRYRGELRGGRLVLNWPAGEQTLTRNARSITIPKAPALPSSTAGSWRWHSRDALHGEVRIEVEVWTLGEDPAGEITGTVERTITVFDPDGRRYDCSGDTFYRYVDRYEVKGRRIDDSVVLRETSVVADPHPCLEHPGRHLDAATGSLSGGYLVLTWRGKRRQVLHRP